MGMIGNQIAAGQALTIANDSFNGDGSAVAFTLSQTVGSVNDIEVLVDNVQQSPYDGSYSVSGTTLTFSGAPSAGTNNVYVIYNASRHITTSQVTPDDGSVTHSKLHTNALDPITLASNKVGIGTSSPSYTLHTVIGAGEAGGVGFLNAAGQGLNIYTDSTASNADTSIDQGATGASTIFRQAGTETMRIDASGAVTKPNQPCFSVRQNGQSGIDARSGYIAFRHIQQTFLNEGNHFTSSDGRFTAPVAGNYLFGCTIRYDAFTDQYFYVTLKKNGGFAARDLESTTGNYLHASVHIILPMVLNDYVDIHLNSVSDSSINIDTDSTFYGYLLG